MKRFVAIAALIASLVSGRALAADVSKLSESVVILYRQTEAGSMQMVCTATVFENIGDEARLLTAAHCLMRFKDDGKPTLDRAPMFASLDEPDNKTFVRVTGEGYGSMATGNDFAVLRARFGRQLPVVALGDESSERAGSAVVHVSAPYGIGKALFTGAIALPKIDRPLLDDDRQINWWGAMLIQGVAAGGASGSAIVSQSTGKIIGILVGHNGPFVIAIPISRVVEQINAAAKTK